MSLKKRLNNGPWPILILTVVCLVCTVLLALTNDITAEQRKFQAEEALRKGKQQAYETAESFKKIDFALPDGLSKDNIVDFEAALKGEDVIGFLVQTQAKGYTGQVPFLVAFDKEGKVLKVVALANTETPGLGQRVSELGFLNQFKGLTAGQTYGLKGKTQGDQEVDALSSATISSKATTTALNNASKLVAAYLKGGH